MNSVYSITTHDERPSEAADEWYENGVCAVGWVRYGNFKKKKIDELPKDVQTFLQIKKGDLILAYANRNRIAYVGEIETGEYIYQPDNSVSLSEKDGGLGYPNQYKVCWYQSPQDFSRNDLPPYLSKQLGKRGKTVIPIDLNRQSFETIKGIILQCARHNSCSYDINEDTVKAGIRKYLRKNLLVLEQGLKITHAEKPTTENERPDFIAKDKDGRTVLIECKGNACATDCRQLERYGETFADKKARLFLIAFKIDDECYKEAKNNPRLELFECDLSFHRIKQQ